MRDDFSGVVDMEGSIQDGCEVGMLTQDENTHAR